MKRHMKSKGLIQKAAESARSEAAKQSRVLSGTAIPDFTDYLCKHRRSPRTRAALLLQHQYRCALRDHEPNVRTPPRAAQKGACVRKP